MKAGHFLFILLIFSGVFGCRVQNNPPELVSISGLSDNKALVGQNISLTGYQFGSDPVVTVGVAASVVTASIVTHDENTITIIVPPVRPGSTQVHVRNDQGTSDPLPFVVVQPPPSSITVSPANGLQGSEVTITGNYLNQLQQVRFDNTAAVVKDSSAQKLTVIVPTTASRGPQPLVIETQGGQVATDFIVAGTPQITSVTPRRTKPGAELVIQGVNLLDGVVRVNGKVTEKFQTTIKDTEIRTTIPADATSGLVTVTVFDKLVATSPDSVLIIQAPFITSLNARDGIAGDKLILSGRNLREVSSVSFSGVAATFRILSDSQIEATIPTLPAPMQVAVSASSTGGNSTATEPFFYYVAPSSIAVTPTRQLRGQAITITGQNLYRITDVRVNGQSVPITLRNEGINVLVNVPDNGTSGPITVINRAGSVSTTTPLIVVQKPIISDVLPAKARPGDLIVVRGDFLLNAQIFFTGTATPAADGGRNTDTERWVLVPADAKTGPLRVVNAAGESTAGSVTLPQLIANVDFNPKSAKVGDDIVLTGQNLTSVQAIRFGNGTSLGAKFLVAGGNFVVTVPVGATTGQICLTNEAGTICTSGVFTVIK